MWYSEEDDGAAGSIPEFGAIFMSSFETKKQCFKYNVFALPSSMTKFVKHIKAGMVLFLFEFKKRQLFGVYQASSDGAVDIVPHAFNNSGMHFSAQVSFTTIWHCDPLSEHDFRDAIRENYFSAKKFKFGLSKDQVRRLLSLFSSRKLENKIPCHVLPEAVVRVASKDKELLGDDRFALSKSRYKERMEHDEFKPSVFRDYHGNSLARAKEDEVFIDDGFNTERKERAFAQGDFLPQKRTNTDNMLIRNYMAENETYNHGTSRTFEIDSSMHSSDDVRKLADARRFLLAERVHYGNQVDGVLNPDLSSDYLISPVDVRSSDDDRFMERLRLSDEYKMGKGSAHAFAKEPYGKPLNKSKYAIDEHIEEHRLYDDFVQREHSVHDIVQPMVYSDGNLDLFRQAREVIVDNRFSMNSKLGSRYHLDCDYSPFSDFECAADLLHNLRKTTTGGRFPFNDRTESKPNFGTSVEDFSSENLSLPLHSGHRIVHDSKYPLVEGRVYENMDDNMFRSTLLPRKAQYPESLDGRVVNDGRYRMSDRVDKEEGTPMTISHFNSMEYPSSSKRSFPGNLLPEKRRSPLAAAHDFDFSRSKFDDATIARAVPYVPEDINFSNGYSASMAANFNSNLLQENHPDYVPRGNFSSKNKSLPYYSELMSSGALDIGPEFGNCLRTNALVYQSSLLHRNSGSFLNSKLSVGTDVNTSTPANHRGPLSPKASLTPPYSGSGNTEREKGLLFAYPFNSSENHCAFDRNPPTAFQHESEHTPLQDKYMFSGKDFIRSEVKDVSVGTCHPERDIASYESLYMNQKENHKISEAPDSVSRKSVFTRLTSRQKRQFSEEKSGRDFNRHDGYMDATADEVMEMLQHSNNLSLKKPKKSRVVGQPEHEKYAIDKKQIQGHINHSVLEKKKLNDAGKAIPASNDEGTEETRVMDFKRRSETDKILVRTKAISESIDETPEDAPVMDFKRRSETDSSLVRTRIESATGNEIVGANEDVKSSTKTTLKRKKLVRPVFRNKEAVPAAICGDSLLTDQIVDKDDKQSCETAISICETEMLNDNTGLKDVQASTLNSTGSYIKELSCSEERKDLTSTSHELEEHETSNMGLQIGRRQVLLDETVQQKSHGIKTSTEGILSEDIDATASNFNLDESNSEGFKLAAGCRNTVIEENKLRMLRSKRKIVRTNWTGVKPSH